MGTTIVTTGGFQSWTDAACRVQATTHDMTYLTTFNVQITGSHHSDMFHSGRIVEDVTLLTAFRERGFSKVQGRPYEVREGDERAVFFCAEDQDPNSPDLSSADRRSKHGGYLGFGTDGRNAVVDLMDDADIGPHIKIICVYGSATLSEWIRVGGRGCSAFPGQAFVYVDPSKKANIAGSVQRILARYGKHE
jgi:hypothetical protein